APVPGQRPVASGPLHRGLFGGGEVDPSALLRATIKGGVVQLLGGPLLGVRVGDEFAITPVDGSGACGTGRVGDVVVDRVNQTKATGRLRPGSPDAGARASIRVWQTRAVWSPMPVRLRADDPRAAELVDAVAASRHVRPAAGDELCAVDVDVSPDGR